MIPFSEKEIQDIVIESNPFGGPGNPIFNYPITPRENYLKSMRGEGEWVPTTNDVYFFHPKVQPCNIARGANNDANPIPFDQLGGFDMFGVEWMFDPEIGGSTVVPGNPLFDDANEWRDKVTFPDVNSWDWETSAAENVKYLDTDKPVCIYFMTGYFERLISFMDFEDALVALIDEDQKAAVKDLFVELTNLYMKIVDKYAEYFPGKIDNIILHDDWGSSRAPFFSREVIQEMLMDEPKRLVEHIKSKGIAASSHCCGNITSVFDLQIEIGYQMIEAQDLVNKDVFYEKYSENAMLTYSPDPLPENPTEEESRLAARKFVDKYFNKGKRILVEVYYTELTTEFLEELYTYSRKKSESF